MATLEELIESLDVGGGEQVRPEFGSISRFRQPVPPLPLRLPPPLVNVPLNLMQPPSIPALPGVSHREDSVFNIPTPNALGPQSREERRELQEGWRNVPLSLPFQGGENIGRFIRPPEGETRNITDLLMGTGQIGASFAPSVFMPRLFPRAPSSPVRGRFEFSPEARPLRAPSPPPRGAMPERSTIPGVNESFHVPPPANTNATPQLLEMNALWRQQAARDRLRNHEFQVIEGGSGSLPPNLVVRGVDRDLQFLNEFRKSQGVPPLTREEFTRLRTFFDSEIPPGPRKSISSGEPASPNIIGPSTVESSTIGRNAPTRVTPAQRVENELNTVVEANFGTRIERILRHPPSFSNEGNALSNVRSNLINAVNEYVRIVRLNPNHPQAAVSRDQITGAISQFNNKTKDFNNRAGLHIGAHDPHTGLGVSPTEGESKFDRLKRQQRTGVFNETVDFPYIFGHRGGGGGGETGRARISGRSGTNLTDEARREIADFIRLFRDPNRPGGSVPIDRIPRLLSEQGIEVSTSTIQSIARRLSDYQPIGARYGVSKPNAPAIRVKGISPRTIRRNQIEDLEKRLTEQGLIPSEIAKRINSQFGENITASQLVSRSAWWHRGGRITEPMVRPSIQEPSPTQPTLPLNLLIQRAPENIVKQTPSQINTEKIIGGIFNKLDQPRLPFGDAPSRSLTRQPMAVNLPPYLGGNKTTRALQKQERQINEVSNWLEQSGVPFTVARSHTGTAYIKARDIYGKVKPEHEIGVPGEKVRSNLVTIRISEDGHIGIPRDTSRKSRTVDIPPTSLFDMGVWRGPTAQQKFGSDVTPYTANVSGQQYGTQRGGGAIFDALAHRLSRSPTGQFLIPPGRQGTSAELRLTRTLPESRGPASIPKKQYELDFTPRTTFVTRNTSIPTNNVLTNIVGPQLMNNVHEIILKELTKQSGSFNINNIVAMVRRAHGIILKRSDIEQYISQLRK